MWRPRFVDSAPGKSLGLVEALEADIRSGMVEPGERLPPQRAIAEALGIDLTTVTRAFNEARRRGLIEAQAGRGTFVSEGRDPSKQVRPLVDLSMNIPPQPAAVDFRRLLSQGIAGILGSTRGLLSLQYQDSAGADADCRAAAKWLFRRIETIHEDRVVVTAGAQSALFALCDLLFRKGDTILAGEVTYPGLKAVAAQKGLKLVPIAMDKHGLIPDALERACRESAPKALYLIPVIDNPTTATLPESRRRAIVALARKHALTLIEDDPYSPLYPKRMTALAELAGDITWHIATLSKCATPSLRVAYVAAPSAAMATRLAGVLRATVLMAPPLMTALASRWIADGTLNQLSQAIRAENIARQTLAASIFAEHRFSADPSGHHLWLRLPPPWRAADFAAHADRAGISIVPSAAFAIGDYPHEAVRLSLGVAPDQGALEDGLHQLAMLLSAPPLATRTVV